MELLIGLRIGRHRIRRTVNGSPMNETDLRDLGLTSMDIDARLIYLESIGTTGQIIDIRGNDPRTFVSDVAVESLVNMYNNEIWEDE